MNSVTSHIGDGGIDALRQIVGNKVVVSISNGSARENGIFFDEALIEYWSSAARRRTKSNFAVPVSGTIESLPDRDGIWIAFSVSQPIEVFGVEEILPGGKPWWCVPATFDFWPESTDVVSHVDIFEEDMKFESGKFATCDVRIEVHFKSGQPLSFEAGAAGWGFVLIARGLRRPWRTRRTLRLRHRLN